MNAVKKTALTASKHAALIAVCSATLIVGKLALSFVPNVEVVTTLIVVYAYVFGYDAVGAALIFCTTDLFLYPPSLDVALSYFLYFPALAGLTVFLKMLGGEKEYVYITAAVIMTALFGVLTSYLAHVVIGLPFLPTYLAGIPFYVTQVISTLIFMSAGFNPLRKNLIKLKSGLYRPHI